jgi:membrane protein DedA with SNARE-associated domain
MDCCGVSSRKETVAPRRWRGLGGCVGSGALLVLLPKCPLCVAGYLAVFTGMGMAAPVAAHLRFALGAIFVASLVYLVGRWFLVKRLRRLVG